MSEKILKEWLNNIDNEEINKPVLFIDDCYSKYKKEISKIKKIEIITPYIYKKHSVRMKNIIIFNKDVSMEFEKINEEKFLYILDNCVIRGIIYIDDSKIIENQNYKNENIKSPSEMEFNKRIINFLLKEQVDISDLEIHYLDKKQFDNFQNMNKEEFTNFIKFREKILRRVYSNIKKIYLEHIEDHILLLFEKNLLTAKIAHYLYRLSELDFYSTTTYVGNNISKRLGIKSKTITCKMIHMITYVYINKNFKAYDLNIDRDLELKKKIAQKLLLLSNSKKLDKHTIAEVTSLPLKEVEKL